MSGAPGRRGQDSVFSASLALYPYIRYKGWRKKLLPDESDTDKYIEDHAP